MDGWEEEEEEGGEEVTQTNTALNSCVPYFEGLILVYSMQHLLQASMSGGSHSPTCLELLPLTDEKTVLWDYGNPLLSHPVGFWPCSDRLA